VLPFPVVKHFNVFKQAVSGLFPRSIVFSIHQFGFQGFEKGFCDSVIITVTFAAHALNQAMFRKLLPEGFTRILDTSIRMNNYPSVWSPVINAISRAGFTVVSAVILLLNECPIISRL